MNDVLLNYFKYLRDTSKNLITSGDLYRSLLPKFSKKLKNEVCQTDIDFVNLKLVNKKNKEYKYFNSYLSQIKKEINRQVYLGVGYIIGTTTKKIFGSIINIPVILDSDYKDGDLSYSLDYENIMLNYDLLSSILPDYFTSEFDNTSRDILYIISDIEIKIKQTKEIKDLTPLIKELLNRIHEANNNVFIEELKEEYLHENLIDSKLKNSIINEKELKFNSNNLHFFISEIPDSISTWQNLKSFCDDVKENNFNSYLLKEFFSNIFYDSKFEKKEIENQFDYTDFLNKFVPIDLSNNQNIAINNCFNSYISYIQGPPGTGKSHTISAILLAAILMDKKVLVVSQKPHALEVVKNKIEGFFDQNINVPFIHFIKDQKNTLKTELANLTNKLPTEEELKLIDLDLNAINESLMNDISQLNIKEKSLEDSLNSFNSFFTKNEKFIKKRKELFNNKLIKEKLAKSFKLINTDNEHIIYVIQNIENKYIKYNLINKYDEILLCKVENKFNSFFQTNINFKELIKARMLSSFVTNWIELLFNYTQMEKDKSKLLADKFIDLFFYDIETLKENIKDKKLNLFKLIHKKRIYENLLDLKVNQEVQRFSKMLYWNRGDKVLEKMNRIDYEDLFKIYPIWLSEIRNIGEILPNKSEMFDLIIVDEASQVNLAEIIPVFYRGSNVCIIGDHKQLGLNSSGLGFSLSKKFDKIIWNKYKPNNFEYEEALLKNLCITKSSILDLLKSEENDKHFTYIMLDEHYRSLPGLANFNNKYFYNNELKIMTEIPTKSLVQSFAAIKVTGEKNKKVNSQEALEVINCIKFLLNKKITKDLNEKYSNELKLNEFVPKEPTIGIISAVRDQVDYIKELLEVFSEEDFKKHRLFCGTPEEVQGDEFDIVIISTTTDESSRNNGHYSNENRFNVATSRSKFFTIFIYSDVSKIPMYEKYLKHFGVNGQRQTDPENVLNWDYEINKNEHGFILLLNNLIIETLKELDISEQENIRLFSNIYSSGLQIKFAIYNKKSKKYFAIEPLGINLSNDSNNYGLKTKKKLELLKKMGWEVITPTYHSFVNDGDFLISQEESLKIKEQIKKLAT